MAFFFAAALPVVVLFYLLKRKRVVRLVSSTMLWRKFLTDTQASAPFQKLRRNWLLLLQLLLLILVILALARPYLKGTARESRLRVIILDASASMQSTDVSPTRFDVARRQALEWVNGLRDDDQMVVLVAAGQTEVKQSATSDKGALRRALQSARVSDAPSRMEEALKLADTLTRDRADAEIHLFSDGAIQDLGEFENQNLRLTYHQVGERGDNAGIVSLDLRANPEDSSQRALFASVRNYSSEPRERTVEVWFNGELVDGRALTLPATNTVPLVFVLPQTIDGVFQMKLTGGDDLGVDDKATAVSLMPRPVKALLVSQGNRFLEKALRGAENVVLETRKALTDPAEEFDVVVLDNVVPSFWPAANTLAIHVINTNWFSTWQTAPNPLIVSWKTTHPIMRYVNVDNVEIGEALQVGPPTWGEPLVESTQTPLVVSGEVERRRLIWVGFDTLQSTWPFRLSFPIFIANAVQWLNAASAGSLQWAVQAGQAFRLALKGPLETIRVTYPDGRNVERPVAPNQRELVFGETQQVGLYTLEAGTNTVRFAVNLLDASESNTKPRESLPFGKYVRVEAASARQANTELWRWLALTGLAVMLWEWWYYHRRTA